MSNSVNKEFEIDGKIITVSIPVETEEDKELVEKMSPDALLLAAALVNAAERVPAFTKVWNEFMDGSSITGEPLTE